MKCPYCGWPIKRPAPTAEEQPLELPPLPQPETWDICDESRHAVTEGWLRQRELELRAALREIREMKAQLADYEKLVLEKVIELGIAPSPKHENEWRNVRAEAAEAKLRAVSEALEQEIIRANHSEAYYSVADRKALLARIRAIVDGA